VAAEVKKQLLNRCNLHTIVRLPNGIFAPYTSIPTNLLFFEVGAPDADEPCTRGVVLRTAAARGPQQLY
jgi:type I restriction enzyme M protein